MLGTFKALNADDFGDGKAAADTGHGLARGHHHDHPEGRDARPQGGQDLDRSGALRHEGSRADDLRRRTRGRRLGHGRGQQVPAAASTGAPRMRLRPRPWACPRGRQGRRHGKASRRRTGSRWTSSAHLSTYDYGEVHFKLDKGTGLRAIVAIHDTRLGPALGGCRFIPYDTDEDALVDALRLARGMTYKAALAGLAHGGGKSVIMRPQARLRPRGALSRVRQIPRRSARPLHHRRGQRHRPRGHGGHPHGDQERHRHRSVARRLGRSVAVHGARRAARHRGGREAQAGQGLARRRARRGAGRGARGLPPLQGAARRRARSSPSPTSIRSRPSARRASSAPASRPSTRSPASRATSSRRAPWARASTTRRSPA